MFGQFFSIKIILPVLFFFIMSGLSLTADPLVFGNDNKQEGSKYVGEALDILSERIIFENLDAIKKLPKDMQVVLLSGEFSSDPEIDVRIRRTESGTYKATLHYKNSEDTFLIQWGVEDVLRSEISGSFRDSNEVIPLIDFTEHAHWMRLRLYNSSDELREFVLELDKNTYSWFDLFYYKGDELISLYGSYEDPMSQRVIQESKIYFPIVAIPGSTDLYMRMESQFFDTVPLRVWTADEFHRQNNLKKFLHGIVSGATLILLVYALYLALSFRERGYLYLAALILSGYMIHLSESGLGMILFWPEQPMGSISLFSIAMPLTILVNLFFCRHYLSLKKLTPLTDKIIIFILFVAASLFIAQFFIPIQSRYGFTLLSIFLDYLSVIPLIYAAYISFRREKAGNRSSLYILVAIGFQLLSYIEFWLSRFNIIPLGLIDFLHMRSIGFAIVMLGGVRFKMQLLEGTIASLRDQLKEIIETKSREQNRKNVTDSTSLKVEAVKDLIEKNFTEPLYRDDLATSVDLSRDHLGRMFKKLTGEKISHYINRLRIEEACRQLGNPDKKIIDIAFDVGFENLRTFNICFFKTKTVSPSEYRKNISSSV